MCSLIIVSKLGYFSVNFCDETLRTFNFLQKQLVCKIYIYYRENTVAMKIDLD